jgi:hypothetical protein
MRSKALTLMLVLVLIVQGVTVENITEVDGVVTADFSFQPWKGK